VIRLSDEFGMDNGETMITAVRYVVVLFIIFGLLAQAHAAPCEKVISDLDSKHSLRIDRQDLTGILRYLNRTRNRELPPKFVTKREARSRGWKPGEDLWSIDELRCSSIGGDRFRNLEGRLPDDKWREADLDYKGGHRGGKRLIFSRDGRRFVTVDHYRKFVEIPECR
jgi:ribonuclease T1